MQTNGINRRRFAQITTTAVVSTATLGLPVGRAAETQLPTPSARRLPRWRGFNLTEKFNGDRNEPFHEADFERLAGWGFNFVRLPMSYRCWADANDC
jgi:endoglucanase